MSQGLPADPGADPPEVGCIIYGDTTNDKTRHDNTSNDNDTMIIITIYNYLYLYLYVFVLFISICIYLRLLI